MDLPVILHIPHSSILIPDQEMAEYVVTKDVLAAENLKLADLYTDELYPLEGAYRAVFPVSRFLVDAERFSDDEQESMSKRGMGVLYTATTSLELMRREISPARRQELLDRYYWPHHNQLNLKTKECLQKFGRCLFIDCHSYPSKPLPYELENRLLPRPQIGIGTDDFHTPVELRAQVVGLFTEMGYEVGLNVPFAGTLVPSEYYQANKEVMSFMIEIRKDLYMNEETGKKLPSFNKICADVSQVLTLASKVVSGHRLL